MKKLFLILAMSSTMSAFADIDCRSGIDHKHPSCYNRGHNHHRYSERHEKHNPPPVVYRDDSSWIAPLIFGAVIGTMISQQNNRPAEPTRAIEPPLTTYRYIQAYDPSCACYKQVLIPIQQ